MFFAFGYAQMRDHANLLLRVYGQARGRAAEYWGKDYLDSDRWVWLNNVPERSEQWWRATRLPSASWSFLATASSRTVKSNIWGADPGTGVIASSPSQVRQIQPLRENFCT